MKLPDDDERRQFGFEEAIPHPRGNIAVVDVKKNEEGKLEWRWALLHGTRYEPETQVYDRIFKIEQGTGLFSVAGEESRYCRGETYRVSGNAPHGFVRVDTTTVVVET